MIFWDTSAVVPLIVDEPGTEGAERTLRSDPSMVVWWGTSIEGLSAVARLERDEALDRPAADAARRTLAGYRDFWLEIAPLDDVREHAARLLLRHPLRAADAMQLAAAMVWARARPDRHSFLTLDERLAEAARKEGFDVIGFE